MSNENPEGLGSTDLYSESRSGMEGVAGVTTFSDFAFKFKAQNHHLWRGDSIVTIWQGKMVTRKLYRVRPLEEIVCIRLVTLGGHFVDVSPLIPVLTKADPPVWKPARGIQLGDEVLVCAENGRASWWEPISDLGYTDPQMVWRFEMEHPECAFCSGILLHC